MQNGRQVMMSELKRGHISRSGEVPPVPVKS